MLPLRGTQLLTSRVTQACLDEFSRVVTASATVDSYDSLDQMVWEWRSTAEIHADPRLARRLRRDLDAAGDPVVRPQAWTLSERRERVAPPPAKSGWDFRYGTSDAVKGWERVCAAAPGNARVAWEKITADPRERANRQHPLKGGLGSDMTWGSKLRATVAPDTLDAVMCGSCAAKSEARVLDLTRKTQRSAERSAA